MSDSEHLPEDPERRDFLTTTTGILAGAGVAAACWPFISSMNPAADARARSMTEVDLKTIAPGSSMTVEWQGKPVFVLHRTESQVRAMAASSGRKDPQQDQERVIVPQWLVVIGLCTHLGCVPLRQEDGWHCPCHGSVFDNSGRILRGPAPRNLDVPDYAFTADEKLVIGKQQA